MNTLNNNTDKKKEIFNKQLINNKNNKLNQQKEPDNALFVKSLLKETYLGTTFQSDLHVVGMLTN